MSEFAVVRSKKHSMKLEFLRESISLPEAQKHISRLGPDEFIDAAVFIMVKGEDGVWEVFYPET